MSNKKPETQSVKVCKECIYIQNKPSLESESCKLCGKEHLKVDRFADDTWKDGSTLDLISFGGIIVKFTLPTGDRLTSTLLDYNRCMPIIFGNEAKWRNGMNAKKRARMGLTKEDEVIIEEFDAWWFLATQKKKDE